ncbi:MAG TPA: zinc-dependent metalloprotease [Balneolaceae bacterium]|nr:zinc-dependent metalloprotease [Balneolaceae bacterium]|tara:strand:+ start:28468 stop:30963 length:2496 start_codon:yes stop_codon:yes gene_type:complete
MNYGSIGKRGLMVMLLGSLLIAPGCKTSKTATAPKSSAMSKSPSKKGDMKKYSEVITKDAVTDEGLFDVHKVDDTYFYEIPDEVLGKEMLLVSRISKTADNIGYGGEKLNTQIVRWEKKDKKILLRHVSYENVATEDKPIFEAVKNSNFEPIIAAFDIEALSEDSTGSVIEINDLFTSDIPSMGLQSSRRKSYQVRRIDGGRTFINHINSYPENIEARNLITYEASNPPSNSSTGTISLEINHSMVMLPEEVMRPRSYDARVSYFSVSKTEYDEKIHKANPIQHITRWKLVPKDKEAYLRGELVEPVEQIVYYIDPATPEMWVPYLIKGINDWNAAFEAAGFKNAIVGKRAPTPEEDPEFSPEDVRYSVIRYFASPVQNAYGPHVHDPRSGQILESDIGWYHNVMNLLRNWYFVQTAAANPKARKVQFDDEVMGELIRFVSSHEVGHTLGFPHNYGSSYAYDVEWLRDPEFTSTHGTAPSIMDYARFNYIAQPGDGVTDFHPAIGEYDKWAAKWGYTWFPEDMSEEEIAAELNSWVVERADDPLYFFGRQTANKIDPRSQNEDLGNNAMKASEYGLANLQVITENLIDWIAEDGENFDDLEELYYQVIVQWGRYMGHVTRNVGGVYENYKTFDQEGPVYSPVEEATQRDAMNFLNRHAFSSPSWAFNEDILSRVNQANAIDYFRGMQKSVLATVLDPQRIARLIEYERRTDGDVYTAFEMMDDVRNGIFSELRANENIDVHRRNLQRAYLELMESLMKNELPNIPSSFREFYGWTQVDVSESDIRPIVRNELEILRRDMNRRINAGNINRVTRVHLLDAIERIDEILDADD